MRRGRTHGSMALGVCVLLGILASTPKSTLAQSRLTTTLDTTLITVGDRISLEVRVEHPADALVSWPDSLDADPFEVLEARVTPTRARGESSVSSAVFFLTTFELGEVELAGFNVRVLHPDEREEVLTTDRYGVEVVSVGVEEGSDIREIRGPLAIPVGILSLLAVALFLMLLGAAVYAAWARRRKGEGDEGFLPGPSPRPAHEIALEDLQRLEASTLLADGQIKQYHIRVSEILRRYVEARFHVPALEMTTWEVIGGLQSAGVDEGTRVDLRRFLDQCDLVKFAKAEPDEAASRRLLELGRALVERTKGPEADTGSEESDPPARAGPPEAAGQASTLSPDSGGAAG
ncbi:MAG: hypothetical protein HKN72_08695 [Gemmatimonadetes bacterium]|nr:hypothetical protein [Gemmatimonadota bacterium]